VIQIIWIQSNRCISQLLFHVSLPGCNAVEWCGRTPTFRRPMLLPSSEVTTWVFIAVKITSRNRCLFIYFGNSSVGIALGYGLGDRGSSFRFPTGAGNFSLHHRVQNGSGPHPASYPMGTRGSLPGGKAAGACSWPLTSIYCRGQRMSGAIPPLAQDAFMAWCSVKGQGQLYLYLLPL
jgi:hypothetical protein